MKHISPLRYPGGKGCLTDFIRDILYENDLQGGTYLEPYAGGAGVALKLLINEHVDSVVINDTDYRIYAIWKSILSRKNQFIDYVMETPLTIDEWKKQKAIYLRPKQNSRIKVGFAAFYLNRCNRSGIINGGAIGGLDQSGKWKIDARFNRENLVERIKKIADYKTRIDVRNLDALELMKVAKDISRSSRMLAYLDPPYYVQGANLYLNHYAHNDHALLADFVTKHFEFPWVMTYDNVPQIRELYSEVNTTPFTLRYSAFESREGKEVVIHGDELTLPSEWIEKQAVKTKESAL